MVLLSNPLNLKHFDISSKINIYGAFVIFMSVKAHFKYQSKFDVTRSLLKNIKKNNVATKNKIYFVLKNITERYSSSDIILMFVENELTDSNNIPTLDPKELLNSIKNRLIRPKEVLTKDFENIIKYTVLKNVKLQDVLTDMVILKMYLRGYISPESVLAIDALTGILNKEILEDDPLLLSAQDKLLKYKKLFEFNTDLIKKCVKQAKQNV